MTEKKHYTARDFLLDQFEKRKQNNELYSMRAFARDIDLSASRTSEFLRGHRTIPQDQGEKLAESLALSPEEREQFLRLLKESARARSKTRSTEPQKEILPLESYCGHWKLAENLHIQQSHDDDIFDTDIEITLINDGADLDCYYVSKDGVRTKNFSTLPENIIKTHVAYDETVRIRTIHESRFLQDRLVIASIFKSIGVDSSVESMICSATTQLFPIAKDEMRYHRQGYTVEVKDGATISAPFELEVLFKRD